MTSYYEHSDPKARVLVFSPRRMLPRVQRALDYELEDVLCRIDRVDLIAPEARNGPPLLVQRALARLGREARARRPFRSVLGRGAPEGPVWEASARTEPKIPLLHRLQPRGRFLGRKDYEVLLFMCQDPSDVYLLGPLEAWRERCARTVVWIDELWANWAYTRPGEMELLGQFDLIVCGCRGSLDAVVEATGTRVIYQPPAVDAVLFCPYPDPPQRCVDVFNMGRRSHRTHEAFLRAAEERGWFYFYDTLYDAAIRDHREHRRRLASLIQRSRFFVANKAKVNAREHTGGQEEVGFRFFEGAAAGAVMIGEPPDTETFWELFPYDGAVTRLPFGSTDVVDVIDALEREPERLAQVRADNVANILARHDFAHRWEGILAALGVEPDPALAHRKRHLAELAAAARSDPEEVPA